MHRSCGRASGLAVAAFGLGTVPAILLAGEAPAGNRFDDAIALIQKNFWHEIPREELEELFPIVDREAQLDPRFRLDSAACLGVFPGAPGSAGGGGGGLGSVH